MNISNFVFTKNNEKVILVILLGLLDGISNNVLTIEECEKILFSPYIAIRLKQNNFDEEIITIINECCELEDIESLIPDKLEENIHSIKKRVLCLLKNITMTLDEKAITIL